VDCTVARKKVYAAENPDKVSATFKDWYERNREQEIARSKAWAKANPGKVKQYEATKYSRHRAKIVAKATAWNKANLEKNYAAVRRWSIRNKDRLCGYAAVRRTIRGKATPDWLTEEQQAETLLYYTTAQAMSEALGTPFEVDHEIPLNHPNVCGLHVPWNLQILPESVNRSKSNRLT
jgi:hypothetical protein